MTTRGEEKTGIVAAIFAAAAIVSGCAPEIVRTEATLSPGPALFRTYSSETAITFALPSGYGRAIEAGTQFREVGTIPQGRVMKPTNAVLSVEGAHVHEAYPVVEGGKLVGFFLPVERAFTPLRGPIPFPLRER